MLRGSVRESVTLREDIFDCLTAREDELFNLTDALLCADGPVTSPVDLTRLQDP